MSSDVKAIFAGLLAERGGVSAFDTAQQGAARLLSEIPAGDQPGRSGEIENLLRLLPSKVATPEPETWDLSQLTSRAQAA
jgi:hypothetical protein